jgi:hypothetical protein
MSTQQAQIVKVSNDCGAVITFYAKDSTSSASSGSSGSFDIDNVKTMDLASAGFSEGDQIKVVVEVKGGDTATSTGYFDFANNGETATFSATGGYLNVTVTGPI